MSTDDLQKRIESSAELSELRDRIASSLAAKSDNRYSFDPFLILAIISIIVQVIQYCNSKRSAEEIAHDMQHVQSLPPRKLMRFKRRSNVLWKKYCTDHGLDPNTPNPIPDAVYALGATTQACAINELINLAK